MTIPLIHNRKFLILADQAVFSGTSFLLTILLAHIISPFSFGLFSGLVLILYLVVSLVSAFVIQPLQVSLATIENTNQYLSFSFWFQTLCSTLLILLFPIVMLIFREHIQEYMSLIPGIILYSVGFTFQDYFRKLFLAQGKVMESLQIDSLSSIFILITLLAIYLLKSENLNLILIILGLSYLPSLVYGLFRLRPFFFDKTLWKDFFKIHFSQGKWLFLTGFVQWWSSNLFVVSSGVFLGVVALGAFRLVQSLYGVINVLFQTFENYVLPQTSRLMTESQDQAKKYLRSIAYKTTLIFGSLLVLLFFCSDWIILLAGGEKYSEYGYVVKGMSILYFFIFLGYPIRIAIRSLVLNKYFFIGYVLTLIFGLLTFKYLLSNYELIGAIIGLVCSQIILLTFWSIVLIKNKFVLWK